MSATLDEIEIKLPRQVLRRILICASSNLQQLEKMEGSQFPEIDKKTKAAILTLMVEHKLF